MPKRKQSGLETESLLNKEQLKAVEHGGGPLLIVAGAGTGKTMVLIERVVWLIAQKNVPASNILAVTFTDKAAGELVERLDKRLPMGMTEVWAMTFHGLCQKILQDHALTIGLPNQFKLLDTTAAWLLVRENLHKFPLKYYQPLGNPTRFIHALLKHFSRCKDESITPADYLNYVQELELNNDAVLGAAPAELTKQEQAVWRSQELSRLKEVAECYHIYQQLLLDYQTLDFGDLILWAVKLLQERAQVLAEYRRQFQHILVDEFQDTNYAQYQLIKLLAAPYHNLTVVGDDDQSIYKFRGASVANILQFKKDYPNCTQVVLTTNYRSRQAILDLAYKSIQFNNPNRLEVELGDGLTKKLIARHKGQGIIEWLHGARAEDEVALVINKIKTLALADADVSYNDFAILVRANDHAAPFVSGLERAGLPVQFLASRGLYSREVVKDIVAYLQLLDDYHESTAMYRILRWPQWGIVVPELVVLTHLANRKSRSLFEVVQEAEVIENISTDTKTKLRQILSLISTHAHSSRDQSASVVIYQVLKDTGYLTRLTEQTSSLAGQSAMRDLQLWYNTVKKFEEASEEKTVKAYLQRYRLEIESGETGALPFDPAAGPDMVKILTIHGAKGLEFKYVFISNLVELRFPSTERREPIELPEALVKEPLPVGDIHQQEERRLFYVACTRAKAGLFFTSAQDYSETGVGRLKRPSLFLRELELPMPAPAQAAIALAEPPTALPEIDELQTLRQLQPKRYSFTQLQAFSKCPLYYRFVYLYKLPIKGAAALSFGNTIHLTLQEFIHRFQERRNFKQTDLFSQSVAPNALPLPSLEELLKIYELKWIDDWFDSPQHLRQYRRRGQEILERFYEQFQKNPPPDVTALEQGFSAIINNYRLYAKIDRIDEVAGGFRLMDYKTGQEPKLTSGGHLPEKIKHQLILYQAILKQVPEWRTKVIKELSYYYLEKGAVFTFDATADDEARVLTWAQKIIEEIIASLTIPTSKLARCGDCEICAMFGSHVET